MALRHRVGWDPQFMERSPWLWPLRAAAARLEQCADWPSRAELGAVYASLTRARGARPLRFVENVRKQDKRDEGGVRLSSLYDARITLGGEVPTRERDWHDLLNALCLTTFPLAKLALHARQYAVLERRLGAGAEKLPAARTKEQDALTLFDEGGALIVTARHDAGAALLAREPPVLARQVEALIAGGRARVVPFGHALFEHLIEGLRCPGGATHLLRVETLAGSDRELLERVDAATAALLDDPSAFTTPEQGGHIRLDAIGFVPRAS